ncbi:ABC transporter permease [Microbispora hainanensis]|jgi:ABC-2 type transport system permease protein|uniref:ABC transporter permease n=1 Tax=Microbispora hainanensis TaxID=568844 RepID=A0ABZ1SSU8_9ACTN|nr:MULTISPECIES: ABC transporter permease [Microbispora]NJP28149.1 ABC transporter permease [Microbispora sp. CL1-1]TQS09331.1 ABC transporter permease [Microbispora sp. SCL1-1]
MNGLWLVAQREIRTRIRTKSYLISLAVSAVLVAALAFLPKVLGGDDTYDVGVVGEAPPPAAQLAYSRLPDEAAARKAVVDGDLDAALINGNKVLANGELDQRLGLILESAHRDAQIKAAGLTITPLTVESVGADARYQGVRTGIATLIVMVLFFLLIYSSMFVAMGVVEEKGSRIVEILLTSVRPWQLLGGKIVGLGALGLVNLVVVIAAGLSASSATGFTADLPPGMGGIVVSAVVWFVLGYAFFSALAAAFGSLVSRQEELNSVLTPMTMLMMFTYLTAYFAAVEPTGTVARVLSFVPPFSSMVMPVRTAAVDVPLVEILIAAVLMVVAVVAVLLGAARVYQRAVLRTGARVKLGEVVR